jgi:ethylmalonyl-CoA mutase
VVEVDVRQEQRARRLLERGEQGLERARGTGVDDRPVDLPGADQPVDPGEVDVDRAAHGPPHLTIRRPMLEDTGDIPQHRLPERDRPWVMRTYAGHSTARESNALYRRNLDKGQTGLSVAFDLPTQTGYDPDHELARGEVGKVGVSIAHKGDMHDLLDGIPLDRMNTSMTINATAAWLLALYMTVAEENGVDAGLLQGTTQNDIIKEFLSRGTYAFPPGPSMRLIADMIAYTVDEVPRWNPINICSYHLQEAGATPVQEIAYALSTAQAVLDQVRARVPAESFPRVFGRISFFVNAGIRFVEEHAKLRAMGQLWEQLGRERYGVTDEKYLRFRYGVQVNSLGLTESQPENNVIRIVLEALAVTLGRNARARAIQLPAWNEALGLPRPWDQQWSLRIQQILAYETDLLEYPDVFEGSKVMDGLVAELVEGARAEMAVVEEHGGAVEAVTYMKTRLVESHRERVARIERGEIKVVGQNSFTSSEASPLQEGEDGGILRVDPEVEQSAIESLRGWRERRDEGAVRAALDELAAAARDDAVNIMPATLAAARAGVTTGEWSHALREVFGEYRAPTGVADAAQVTSADEALEGLRERVERVSEALGRRVKILVGKPGLDGHSNGAEQIAVRARDAGMDVVYEGIRLTPSRIATTAVQEGVHVVGLSILSGSHRELIPTVIDELRAAGADVPVVVGGIIPQEDVAPLQEAGVARVYTPKDFELTRIMGDIVELVAEHHGVAAPA